MLAVLPFLEIDPVLFELGPLVIRWYALAYIAGLIIGWRYCRHLAAQSLHNITPDIFDDFLVWAVVAVVLGGRLGYIFFYKPDFFLSDPWQILTIWRGGMSFHGGFLGVLVALAVFAWKRNVTFLALADVVAAAAPIGLFFGRIANFVNGELYGRRSDVYWAMVFPHGGADPRHPSQLYEALLEGFVLFIALYLLWRIHGVRTRTGFMSGVFLAGYGTARAVAELFREPDQYIGFLSGGVTLGQALSLPMIIGGFAIIVIVSWRKVGNQRTQQNRGRGMGRTTD